MSNKGTLINDNEYQSLYGLPHIQQLIYLRAIRPYMDYRTGIVGIKRKISYQSLSEEIYVEPHTGYCSKKYSRAQLRRALEGLVRAGLLFRESRNKQLIFQCLLATRDNSAQNKAVTNPSRQAGISDDENLILNSDNCAPQLQKAVIPEIGKPGTPPVSGNFIIILREQFESFWELYPLKKSKEKAWEQFLLLKPTEILYVRMRIALVEQIDFEAYQRSCGKWIPAWRYLANWLAQRGWEDELGSVEEKEKENDATSRVHVQKYADPFWESCKDGSEGCEREGNNVVEFKRRQE